MVSYRYSALVSIFDGCVRLAKTIALFAGADPYVGGWGAIYSDGRIRFFVGQFLNKKVKKGEKRLVAGCGVHSSEACI